MSTIRTNAILDSAGGNTATINGFMPVQQGGPTGTNSSKIYLGYRTDNSGVIVQVGDGSPYLGRVVTTTQLTAGSSASTQINAPGDMPLYACRAWVNFNGTGVVAIRASGNVSSITDNGVGDYTVNFTTAMPDANYAFVGTASAGVGAPNGILTARDNDTKSTTQLTIRTGLTSPSATANDAVQVSVAIFR